MNQDYQSQTNSSIILEKLASKNNVGQNYGHIKIGNHSFIDDSLCNYESDLEKNNSPDNTQKININNLVARKNLICAKDDYFKQHQKKLENDQIDLQQNIDHVKINDINNDKINDNVKINDDAENNHSMNNNLISFS